MGGWQWCVTGALGAVASCGRSHGLTRGEASEGVRGPVKGEDPPEDKVPILKSETDEVLALAGLSHLLPGKQRASGVPSLESEYLRCLWPPPSSLPLPWPPGARNPKT